ncbi:hypothetical protein A3A93_05320 [Candidatus Roizmanbacteria bacterium RIFCSPLOWO2_01_FULL_38_12]|uniref:PEGA domain-containing protein n=1 Tax=Candidatus Roizmanbacteria bacterium RIFCSPLOWO2_01_FULL_38_12 TaxID=1802061 RepID=A0A1F7IZ25_9BACT|nr:MAG: hypothetical protein A2861_03535 [Candidatus Roizmanbacteria bacterium RIFCSPHIGHO2_01_FULL_38_15]OGK35644.1 MAG: hypothetical protein A3F59_01750 [Candidatus Roizmanbacteria bacterium RIFCSPHIGHO2_12_FULL_38_13]OGK48610.1 MAG: hypothetical protein A3A93_05320 [Candidatus Roizmanbacteria bacterium RIFCSPLOWO2_01_FULL_38_12]
MKIILNVTKSIVPRIILFGFFVLVLIAVIAYARGYRINFDEGTVTSTGILSVNSTPRPAKVYVNGELKGATDVNLTLPFGKYNVEVKKDGYTSWQKQVSLKGEIVMSLDARLFSKNPSLTPLTNLGVMKAIPIGNTDKLILISQTGDVEADGIYLFEVGNKALAIFPPLKPLLMKSLLLETIDISTATVDFAPNYRQGILTFIIDQGELAYLISLEDENTQLFEITASKENIITAWNEEKNVEALKIIETLPKKIVPIALSSFQIISLSPDEKKLLYLAKEDATIPIVLEPQLIGANQTVEHRDIKKNSLYIYDKKEDKNFLLPIVVSIDNSLFEIDETPSQTTPTPETATSTAQIATPKVWNEEVVKLITEKVHWYPTSDYLAAMDVNQIKLLQYDGTNEEIVYAGPFQDEFFTISPDWNVLVIINLNPQLNDHGDLYSVGIK